MRALALLLLPLLAAPVRAGTALGPYPRHPQEDLRQFHAVPLVLQGDPALAGTVRVTWEDRTIDFRAVPPSVAAKLKEAAVAKRACAFLVQHYRSSDYAFDRIHTSPQILRLRDLSGRADAEPGVYETLAPVNIVDRGQVLYDIDYCEIHGAALKPVRIPIHYGMPAFNLARTPSEATTLARFPHAQESDLGGCCIIGPDAPGTAPALHCAACLTARRTWQKSPVPAESEAARRAKSRR